MDKILSILLVMLAFFTGFISSYAVNSLYINTESPFLFGIAVGSNEPGNWVSKENIEILQDKIIIYVKNAVVSEYADTGSMLPTLGKNTNGIRIKPATPEQIKVGDIISFKQGNDLIVHRVVGKGKDSKGVYFVTKGDNNSETDGKVYFPDIKYVTIALIY